MSGFMVRRRFITALIVLASLGCGRDMTFQAVDSRTKVRLADVKVERWVRKFYLFPSLMGMHETDVTIETQYTDASGQARFAGVTDGDLFRFGRNGFAKAEVWQRPGETWVFQTEPFRENYPYQDGLSLLTVPMVAASPSTP